MLQGPLRRAASCSRCSTQHLHREAVFWPAAESSAQAARRYASLAHRLPLCVNAGATPATSVRPSSQRFFSSSIHRAASRVDVNAKGKARQLDMEDFPRDRIRNICIIAHIDHGKSTLADRLLQLTGTLPASSSPQFLDKLKVEKERGITVKAQTVSLVHEHTDGKRYLINLIDTPGHVDFSYEVSRSLGACEGGLLLVDCTQGIQAQTLSVFHYAQEANLTLLPVINKVDLPHANPAETSEEIVSSLGLPGDGHLHISAKSGLGVPAVLSSIIDNLPPPKEAIETDGRLRGLVFDTFYDHFRGVVSLVRLFSGSLKKGDKVRFLQAGKKYDVLEVGVHNPEEVPVDVLLDGQVGYVVCNMKNSDEAHIGDTICLADRPVEPLPGFKPMKAMVYAGVFPVDSGEFPKLEEAIERLTLNDRSVSIQRESSAALSQGFRLGFLGTLHMDVFRQRLEDEYESNVIITSPTVPYKVVYKDGRELFISNPAEFPDVADPKARVERIEEPMVAATIFVPNEYIGEMMTLCAKYRGTQQEYKILDNTDRAVLRYSLPLSEIVTDFFSELKSASSGFASFDYEEAAYEQSDLVKLNMMLNSKPVDALAMVVHRGAAQAIGRVWTKKLREVLPRQLFELAIQAAIGTKVVARETLSAMRKDVTAGLYGGHYERKMKHLEKQKKGKQRLKSLAGNINVPQSAFFEVLSSRPRGFSTMADSHRSYVAAAMQTIGIADFMPPADPVTTPKADVSPPEPIYPHELPPHIRSKHLSDLMTLASQPRATSADIYTAWSNLYLAAPNTRIFTPTELLTVLRAMHRADQRHRERDRSALERSAVIKDVLADTRSRSVSYYTGLILLSELRMENLRAGATPAALRRAEASVLKSFPRAKAYTSVASALMYRRMTNQLLYLAAKGANEEMFDRWIGNRRDAGFEEDGFVLVARLLLQGNLGNTDEMVQTYVRSASTARQDYQEVQGEYGVPSRGTDRFDGIVPLNLVLWKLALAGRWDIVAGTYHHLSLSNSPGLHDPEIAADVTALLSPRPAYPLIVPPHLRANDVTYSLLIRATSYQGNLPAALEFMRHMFGAGFAPHLHDYMALFEGFARYGEVPSYAGHVRGELASYFPDFTRYQPYPTPSDAEGDSLTKAERRQSLNSFDASSIWSAGAGLSGASAYAGSAGSERARPAVIDGPSTWTADVLDHLFDTFLTLSPKHPGSSSVRQGGDRAPHAKGLWNIMLAFARTRACDEEVLMEVWRSLRRKFGPAIAESGVSGGGQSIELEHDGEGGGVSDEARDPAGENEEGWRGWKLDARMKRLEKALSRYH